MSESWDRQRLRTTFEEVPELYDRARPSYPPQVFADLVELAQLGEGGTVLEIGCGTGKATIRLAELGLDVVCVELGEQLARVTRRNLAGFPNVEVVHADFETWDAADGRFDAIVAFTAFHWIDPVVRYAKSARLLHDRGRLAVLETRHVLPGDGDPFFVDVQADYDAVASSDENRPAPPPDEVEDLRDEIDASGHFCTVAVRRYLWDVVYTADEYVALLDTFSGHRALEEETRARLYERIHRRIEARPERVVRNTRLAVLNVAERREPRSRSG